MHALFSSCLASCVRDVCVCMCNQVFALLCCCISCSTRFVCSLCPLDMAFFACVLHKKHAFACICDCIVCNCWLCRSCAFAGDKFCICHFLALVLIPWHARLKLGLRMLWHVFVVVCLSAFSCLGVLSFPSCFWCARGVRECARDISRPCVQFHQHLYQVPAAFLSEVCYQYFQ